jgi:hypothetical protein
MPEVSLKKEREIRRTTQFGSTTFSNHQCLGEVSNLYTCLHAEKTSNSAAAKIAVIISLLTLSATVVFAVSFDPFPVEVIAVVCVTS